LFTPGAASNGFNLYGSGATNGQASGSVPFTLPAAATPGTYELRLFAGGYTLLATSNSFTVAAPRSVSGTVTLNGSPLAAVAFAATNGVTCAASNTSGQYSCTVPLGWSGSVTPSLGGYNFTPTSRSYTNLQTNQTGQNFIAAAAAAQIYYIEPDHLNTPRTIANASGTTVWRWDQAEPFGNSVPNADPDGDGSSFDFPLRFPGQYFDRETGNFYNMARDYSVETGRYIQSDLIGLRGGLNTYTYAYNNPLRFIDPTGLQTFCGCTIACAGFPGAALVLCIKTVICLDPCDKETVTRTYDWYVWPNRPFTFIGGYRCDNFPGPPPDKTNPTPGLGSSVGPQA